MAGAHGRGAGRAGPGHVRPRRAVREGPPPVRRADRELPGPAAPLRRPAHAGRRQPPARLRGRVGARRGRAHGSCHRRPSGLVVRRGGRRGGRVQPPRPRRLRVHARVRRAAARPPGQGHPPAARRSRPRAGADRRAPMGSPTRPIRRPSWPPPPIDPPEPGWTSGSIPRPRPSGPRCATFIAEHLDDEVVARAHRHGHDARLGLPPRAVRAGLPGRGVADRGRRAWVAAPSTSACSRRSCTAPALPSMA